MPFYFLNLLPFNGHEGDHFFPNKLFFGKLFIRKRAAKFAKIHAQKKGRIFEVPEDT